MMDFSKKKYKDLCRALLDSGYEFVVMSEYIENQHNDSLKQVVMRHDLCRNAKIGTMGLVDVERELGIKSTYYFRNPESYDLEIMAMVAKDGHEIGVHFDALDKAKGDFVLAKEILIKDLLILREIAPVKTVAMHGNPSSSWDNRDLFSKFSLDEFDLVGEGYLSVDFNKIWYYSDTGRNWTEDKNNVKDIIPFDYELKGERVNVETTDDIIKMVSSIDKNLYFLVHPNRWRESISGWYWKYILDQGKNVAKSIYMKILKNKT